MGRKRKPLREFEIDIHDLSSEGAGVGRLDDKVWFVDGALPGERVRFREDRRGRRHGRGQVLDVIRASPNRIDSPCQYFGVCGGCVLQHLEHGEQVRQKESRLLEDLDKIGQVKPDSVLDPVVADPWHYRRRARLGVRLVPKKGGVLVGFRERKSSYITALDTCMTLRPEAARLLPGLPAVIEGLTSPSRIPQIEVSVGDDSTSLIIRHLEALSDIDCIGLVDWAQKEEVQVFLQPKGLDSIHCIWPISPRPLSYRLPEFNLDIRFSPIDFVQVNGPINERLVTRAVELLNPSADEQVVDLFAGVGNFSLALARRASAVLGIEGSEELVNQARENATLNGIGNTRFEAADLFEDENTVWSNLSCVDKLLIDPPRSGAMAVVKQLGAMARRPSRIVYISCNPSTLARDCQVLVNVQGYRLVHAGVVDMFPHTAHIESIAVLDSA